MPITVAEYYGQRTDFDSPVIVPAPNRSPCPFADGLVCPKCKDGGNPVCVVRKDDGTFWIVCEHRLCATKKNLPLCDHQKGILLDVARRLFDPSLTADEVFVKREVYVNVANTQYHADYIMTYRDGHSPLEAGPDRVILEMQGGGETSQTGKMTRLVNAWKANPNRTNEELRSPSDASPLITNAWRRQQEQFIVKGNIAMQTWKGYGIAFCVGTLLYDHLKAKLRFDTMPDLRTHNWTLALVGIKEDETAPVVPGPIPLKVDESRLFYTNYQTFVHALINQGIPSPDAFSGTYLSLNNNEKNFTI